MELTVPIKLLISLLIGAAIGLEREIHERHDEETVKKNSIADIAFIGVRTLSLTTALGTLAGVLYADYLTTSLFISITFGLLLIIHYVLSCIFTRDLGVTTEIAVIYCFFIGMAIGLELFSMQLILGMSVILMLILSSKDIIKNAVQKIKQRELKALISYAIIALVILPSLPDTDFTLGMIPFAKEISNSNGLNFNSWKDLEILNPFSMWMVVAIFTGVDVLGYALERTLGQGRGMIITTLVGGFVSSTATTQSIAVQSKKSNATNQLAAYALLATFASFFSVSLLLLPINPLFFLGVLPTLLILMAGFGIASVIFLRFRKQNKKEEFQKEQSKHIFSLKPALIFALLYVGIKLISRIALQLFGENGFLVTSALAAFTGIDAVSINLAQLVGGTISMQLAVLTFIIINAVNLIAKTTYIYFQGSKELAIKYGATILTIIATSFAGLLFI